MTGHPRPAYSRNLDAAGNIAGRADSGEIPVAGRMAGATGTVIHQVNALRASVVIQVTLRDPGLPLPVAIAK